MGVIFIVEALNVQGGAKLHAVVKNGATTKTAGISAKVVKISKNIFWFSISELPSEKSISTYKNSKF